MKLRLLAAVAVLVWCVGAASAQIGTIGVYVNPVFDKISNSLPDSGTFAFLGSGNTSAWFRGAAIGGYYMVPSKGKLSAGADVRATLVRNNNAPLTSFLLGVRIEHKSDYKWKTYAEVLGGVGRTHPPTNPFHVSKPMWSVYGGADYPLSKHVDWRVVEVGYGQVQTVTTGIVTGGTVNPLGSSSVLQLSTGLTFKF